MLLTVNAHGAGEYAPWLRDVLLLALAALASDAPDEQPDLLGADELALLAALGQGPAIEEAATRQTLQALLDDGISRTDPRRPAILDGETTLTFGELDASAEETARLLLSRGMGPGDRVGVLAGRTWRTVVAFAGILRAGLVYVPVDPEQPAERIRALITRVNAATVLGSEQDLSRSMLPENVRCEVPRLSAGSGFARSHRAKPADPAYVIFTSGSTGAPRPVLVSQGAVAALHSALAATVYAEAVAPLTVAVNSPAAFDASIKQLIQLASGHTLCLMSERTRQDPPRCRPIIVSSGWTFSTAHRHSYGCSSTPAPRSRCCRACC
ncbi:AMP-binding protein [Micromonospora sp. WMMA1976]|uniref:AMP-binding protein n=1 Tax=Micromonospora sp. WMMA1976 TaxID=3014995 RepID=UPI00248BD0BA|nr:AMP-binding protein [Micromonospora sp. WMMA1976]WBC01110.1 AMP-binding protein [Micromonospora sp. WMMA1976]